MLQYTCSLFWTDLLPVIYLRLSVSCYIYGVGILIGRRDRLFLGSECWPRVPFCAGDFVICIVVWWRSISSHK